MMFDWSWLHTKRCLSPGSSLFEEGDIALALVRDNIDVCAPRKEEFPCGIISCIKRFDSLMRYEAHYNNAHRHVCATCHRCFPSSHLVDLHVLETHDTMFQLLAAKQDMYQCLLKDWALRFKTTKKRKNHMIHIHKYPSNFRFDRNAKSDKASNRSAPPKIAVKLEQNEKQMDIQEPEVKINSQCEVRECDKMETEGIENQPSMPAKYQYCKKVPTTICFGSGAIRGFQHRGRGHGRGRGSRHWHQTDTKPVDIQSIAMTDLADALNT